MPRRLPNTSLDQRNEAVAASTRESRAANLQKLVERAKDDPSLKRFLDTVDASKKQRRRAIPPV